MILFLHKFSWKIVSKLIFTTQEAVVLFYMVCEISWRAKKYLSIGDEFKPKAFLKTKKVGLGIFRVIIYPLQLGIKSSRKCPSPTMAKINIITVINFFKQ